jgi:hypothetical protein
MSQVITKFKSEADEDLMSTINMILQRCYQLPPQALQEDAGDVVREMVTRCYRKFFGADTPQSPRASLSHLSQRFRAKFEADFMAADVSTRFATGCGPLCQISGTTPHDVDTCAVPVVLQSPRTTLALIEKLREWRDDLLQQVQHPASVRKLERHSPLLADFACSTLEVPGQYCSLAHPTMVTPVRIARFDADVGVRMRHGFPVRRVGMRGDNGRDYHFLVQLCTPLASRSDERMLQVSQVFNQLLGGDVDTRRRRLSIRGAVAVPVTMRLRLVEDDPSVVDAGALLQQRLAAEARCSERLITAFAARVCSLMTASPSADGDAADAARERAFGDMCRAEVPDTLLSQSLAAHVPSWDTLALFRSCFTAQMGISAFLAYVFVVGDRALHKVREPSECSAVHGQCLTWRSCVRFGVSVPVAVPAAAPLPLALALALPRGCACTCQILIALGSGDVINADFRPSYSVPHRGAMVSPDAVPFRLTRNFQVSASRACHLPERIRRCAVVTQPRCDPLPCVCVSDVHDASRRRGCLLQRRHCDGAVSARSRAAAAVVPHALLPRRDRRACGERVRGCTRRRHGEQRRTLCGSGRRHQRRRGRAAHSTARGAAAVRQRRGQRARATPRRRGKQQRVADECQLAPVVLIEMA